MTGVFVVLILCLSFLSSCSGMSVQTANFFTMDTFAESTVITKEASLGKEANEKIQEICEEIEGRISNTIETSEIYQINAGNAEAYYKCSDKTGALLALAWDLYVATDGAFNAKLGEIIDLWGINDQDGNAERKLPEKDDFYPALERAQQYGGEKFNLGGIGKGYALDEISGYLAETGIPNALVSFGSSVLAAGTNRTGNLWTVGIKDPLNPDSICGVISASDKVISVTGGYERYITINGVDYVHVIDPETGYPVDNDLLCVVVVMNSQSAFQTEEQRELLKNHGAISDALSTALFVMGKEKALNFYNRTSFDFEMILFIRDDGAPKGYDIIATNVMFTELD